jgi:glycosyltransferase involved in cell wall biosynthesis
MKLGIDASSIRSGGGITHLREILKAAEPSQHGFQSVVVWAGRSTLEQIGNQPWLQKVHEPLLDKGLLKRAYWQRVLLRRRVEQEGCCLLFVPGGAYTGSFRPFVTMSRNMLPFEPKEIARYGLSRVALRLRTLRTIQRRTFARADGVVFLSKYAQHTVIGTLPEGLRRSTTIPHGVSEDFWLKPREEKPLSEYSPECPLRCLYVSSVTVYKHQWRVAEAVSSLRQQGYPLTLDLLGPATTQKGWNRLRDTMNRVDPKGEFISYHGAVPYEELPERYRQADLNVFASSCENMPNTLLEAMAAGLPIACSNRGPMPEMLGDSGVYFDPEDAQQIEDALRELVDDQEKRIACARDAHERALSFPWSRCARDTFDFLAQVATAT